MARVWLIRRRQSEFSHEGWHDHRPRALDGPLHQGVIPHLRVAAVRCLVLKHETLSLLIKEYKRSCQPRRVGVGFLLILSLALASGIRKSARSTVFPHPRTVSFARVGPVVDVRHTRSWHLVHFGSEPLAHARSPTVQILSVASALVRIGVHLDWFLRLELLTLRFRRDACCPCEHLPQYQAMRVGG